MKTPTNNLYQLIQSMTAAEKRYFKIHFSSSKSLVTKLFDYINSMSEYDEELVKENFKDSKLSKNLKVYKIMLIDLLLKSLSSFRYKKNLKSNIGQGIEEVETLIEKKLYADAYKRLNRVKELCEKFEEWNSLLTILDLEFQLKVFHGFNFPNSHANKKDILSSSIAISDKIKTINELRQLNFELSGIANRLLIKTPNPNQLQELKEAIQKQEKTLKLDSKAPNFKTNYYYNSALSHLYHCLKELDKEYLFKKKILALFEAHPHFKENNPEQFWAAKYNFINCCDRYNKEKEMLECIEHLKHFTKQIPEFQRKMTLIYLVEIHHYYQKNDFKTIENKIEPVAIKHIQTLDNPHDSGITRTHLILSLSALATGDQTKVQYYLRRLFESGKKMEDSFSYFFEVINFISHYEANDIEILRHLLTSKKRKMKRNSEYGSPFFKEIVQLFSALINEDSDKQKLAQDLKKKFPEFKEDGLYILMNHFILQNWIQAIESGISYAEQVKLKSSELLSNGV